MTSNQCKWCGKTDGIMIKKVRGEYHINCWLEYLKLYVEFFHFSIDMEK